MFAGIDQTSIGHKETFVPTTLNPSDKSADVTLSNGNLTITAGSLNGGARGIVSQSAGKHYFEITVDLNIPFIGLATALWNLTTDIAASGGANTDENIWVYRPTGNTYHGGAAASYGDVLGNGDIIMVAADFDAGKIWWGGEGVWFESGDPAAGTNPAYSDLTAAFPFGGVGGPDRQATFNFGQSPFVFEPPAGFFPGWGTLI
ncbi:MAG: SPRY domain-containing protein [Rhodospirillales bacterium]